MTIPKSIHHVITSFLKGELEKAGIKTVFTAPDTPSGRRTDLFCENGLYIVETAFTEKSLLEAINKIQTFRSRNLGIKGGFAILCPDKLSESVYTPLSELLKVRFKILLFSLTDTRNFTVYEGTLPEIAEMLKTYLREPVHGEPSLEWIIMILRMTAAYIAEGLKVTGAHLEPIFQDNHVFRNILQKKEKYPLNALKLVSAYLVVNQLLFYHILSKKNQLPEIDTESLATPSQLNRYFDLVSAKSFQVLFSYDVVSKIPKEYTTHLKKVVNIIKGITPEIKKDVLGTIFHNVIPLDVRKYIAAFYTNVYAADLLAWLSIDDPDACVADFAVGSGGLLVAAYKRKKHLLDLEYSKKFTEKDHKKFINQIVGVDVMPFAANTAACHLALQYPECDTAVNIAVWDSTALQPYSTIPLIAVATPAGENPNLDISLTQYDVILMNPPFTRQERVPTAYKPLLGDQFNDYKEYLHGQLSYYGYFVLLADRFLKEGGRLAFVLPAAFLRVHSSRTIVALLANKYHIEYIITGKKRLNFSESTWRREILLVARKLKKEKRKNTIFAVLESLPKTEDELEQISKKIKKVTSDYEDHDMSAFTVPAAELEKDLDWFRFITPFEPGLSKTWEKIRTSALHLEKFGDIYNVKTIKEGIESRKGMKVQAVFVVNSKERAIRKEDAWIVDTIKETYITVFNRYNNTKIHIPKESIIPCLRTMSHNPSMNIDTTDFVVVKDFFKAHQFFYGKRAVLKTRLPVWNQYVKDRIGNLIILRRFVITAPGTTHVCYYSPTVTAAPGTAWVTTVDDDDAKILCLWFNSSIHLAQVLTNRIEDIWIDIHKYILREFSIINPHTLSNKEKKKLLEIFDKLSKEKTPPLAEQYTSVPESKKEIDIIILSVLGFDDNEIEKILSDLYASLKTEFEALQKINCSSW